MWQFENNLKHTKSVSVYIFMEFTGGFNMRAFTNIFDKVESSFVFLSKVVLILMMLVTSIDSLWRYLLSKPLVGAYEFTEMYLMIIVVFLSISFVMKNGGHIYLDIVIYRLSKKAQNYL